MRKNQDLVFVSEENNNQEGISPSNNVEEKIVNSSTISGFNINGSISQFNPKGVNNDSDAFFALPLSWRKLTYSVKDKIILHSLTGTALPSRCLAIMGASGAGKTTFLNAIADKLATSKQRKLQGTLQLGDVVYKRNYRKIMGFVGQDDILSPWSTPEDSLRFSVRVRRGTDPVETASLLERTLEELRLEHCRRTIIGTPGLTTGLSGGERKRTSIGVELICGPKILLLDEPTSGLDTATSEKIAHILNMLSRTGRTVICTIHQPSAGVLEHFDDLMLLSQGHCVYHGTMSKAVEYFESIGHPCPKRFTPTDFFMTLLHDPETSAILIEKWKEHLKCAKRTPHTTAVELNSNNGGSVTAKVINSVIEKQKTNSWIQFAELSRRLFGELLRKRAFLLSSITQAIFFGLLMGLIFLNLKTDVTSIQDRQGLLFMTAMNRAMGQCFMMINAFGQDRALYLREQQTGSYSPFLYFLSRSIVDLPLRALSSLIESIFLYWMAGLHRDAGSFFYYVAVLVVLSEVTSGLGFAIGAIFKNLAAASGTAPALLLPLSLAGGLWANTERLRPYWYFLEKLSFFRHAFILLIRNEMKYITQIDCDPTGKPPDYCSYQPKNGNDVLRILGFEDAQSTDLIMWFSLIIMYLLFRVLLVVVLYVVSRSKV